MKAFFKIFFLLNLLCFFPLIYPCNTFGGIDLPWSTTYDCSDWTSYSQSLDCNGLSKYLGYTACGHYEEILSSGNMAGGGGGKGQRHWICDGYNCNSGGTRLYFNTNPNEIWMRWYMRFEEGWDWERSYTGWYGFKILYFDVGNNFIIVGIPGGSFLEGNGKVNFAAGGSTLWTSLKWDDINATGALVDGHRQGDGLWHCYEIHIKCESVSGAGDGELHFWFDGVQKYANTSVTYNKTELDNVIIGSNAKYPLNGACVALDFDDIAISNTGYIGPIAGGFGGGGSIPPSPPQDLKLK